MCPDQRPRNKRWLIRVGLIMGGLLAVGLVGRAVLGVHTVRADAEPFPIAVDGLDYGPLDEVLGRVVRGGGVDYHALLECAEPLRRFVATLETTGPQSRPELFVHHDDQLAYYINAYNALVLLGALAHWPIETVHDVRGLIEPKAGFGFFWAQRFRLDGRSTHLYGLENDILREQFRDARIHAAINCASRSCPTLAPGAYLPSRLEAQLDRASLEFASRPPHVVVSHDAEEIWLSSIYQWFAEDFGAHARSLGVGNETLDWVAHFASSDMGAELALARTRGYAVRFAEYDWSLNSAPDPSDSGGGTRP